MLRFKVQGLAVIALGFERGAGNIAEQAEPVEHLRHRLDRHAVAELQLARHHHPVTGRQSCQDLHATVVGAPDPCLESHYGYGPRAGSRRIADALRAIPKLYCVTDSTAAAGMPDGEYKLGSHTVTKCLGGVRLADGTLAGSTLTMDQALRNLVKIGLPLAEASQRLSQFPADYLGITERGRLQPGAWADCVRLDRSLTLTAVMVEGEDIDFKNA